jgi:hypothetical protein
MRKLNVILSLVVLLAAAGSAVATQATSSKGLLFKNAYERLTPSSCQPITVDDNCNPGGMHDCVAGKVIVQNGPTACSVILSKP